MRCRFFLHVYLHPCKEGHMHQSSGPNRLLGISDAQSRNLSIVPVRVDFGTAPMTVSNFCPSLKTMTVGMLRMPYSVATLGLSSVFSLTCNSQRTEAIAGSVCGNVGWHPWSIARRSCTYAFDLVSILGGDFVDQRCDHPARAAPRGPEIHQDRHARFQDDLIPVFVRHCAHCVVCTFHTM